MIYKEWLNLWLENYVKPSSKGKTFVRYSEIVSQHIAVRLGDYRLTELTPLTLQRFVTELLKNGNRKTGKGLSANSVNGIITVLQNSLKAACAVGIADKTVCAIKRPSVREKKISCFTLTEQKALEREVLNGKKPKMFGVVLCLYTGLRIGELLALTWKDIDLAGGTLAVTKSCYDGKNDEGKFGRITDTPKTPTSQRTIPIPRQLLPHLSCMKKMRQSEFVVSDSGKPMLVRSYQRSFELLLARLNIPRRGFHALRHTFATRALECGMDVKTLSEILGHKNAGITLNRYAHSMTDHKKDMMNRLGKLL